MTKHVRTRSGNRRKAPITLGLVGLFAALAAVLVPLGAAKPPSSDVKKYDVCLQAGGSPSCSSLGAHTSLPGGSLVSLELRITNEAASNQSLGSARINAPAELPISGTVSSSLPGTIGAVTANRIELQNLGLSPGAPPVVVTFSVTTPCSGGPFTWNVPAKQSNQFLGTGNDFSLIKAAGLVSDIQECFHVEFVNEPDTTVVGATITDDLYSRGDPLEVGVFDQNNARVSDCGIAAAGSTVTITKDQAAGSLTGNSESFACGPNGLAATFDDLSIGDLAQSAARPTR